MRRLTIYGLCAAISLLVVIGGTLVVHRDTREPKATNGTTAASGKNNGTMKSSSAKAQPGTACALLTATNATKVLGKSAKTSQSNGLADSETGDTKVTECTYIKTGSTPDEHEEVSVQVHTAKSSLGARGNQTVFGSERPKGTTTVSGFGDAAFWDQSKGELNILQHNNWYVISILHDTSPSKTQLSEVKQAAKLIMGEL